MGRLWALLVARYARHIQYVPFHGDVGQRLGCDQTAAMRRAGDDPDSLFVQGAAQNRAKAVCLGCPVRTECLADALDNRIEFGVWGGMTERERRALLRRRPNVTSWRGLLRDRAGATTSAATAARDLVSPPRPRRGRLTAPSPDR